MIYITPSLEFPLKLKADLCVVGAGAGGSMVARTAADAGMKVVVLEAGGYFPPSGMNQREEDMLPKLFWDSGGRTTRDRSVKIHQGRGIGGSTLHNTNLIKRIPDPLLEQWIEERGMEHLPKEAWDALYTEVEKLLGVGPIPDRMINTHNKVLEKGCTNLGWEGGILQHNRTDCVGSGFCELGCAFDAKNNACKVLVPQAIADGAEFFTHCRVKKLTHNNGRITGVEAFAVDPVQHRPIGNVTVEAEMVCLAASATATPTIIKRSGLDFPSGSVGESLRIHPAVIAAGVFDENINAWEGIPQSYECTEYLDFEQSVADEKAGIENPEKANRTWIVPAFAHPMGTATMMPGHGANHEALMSKYPNIAVLTAMIHDLTKGEVNPNGELDLTIDYWPHKSDRRELHFGLKACAELLFAGGAKKVIIPANPLIELNNLKDIQQLDQFKIRKGDIDITAVHPMGSVPMGDDPNVSAVDSRGKFYGVEGLWIGDGSLFPSSIGGPPQLSIYSMGLHVGRGIVQYGKV